VTRVHFKPSRPQAATDADIVRACLAGDETAWHELVNRFGRLVYSIPARYGFGDADAQDVFQTVFTILYRKLDGIREAQSLASWLIRTTHRECFRFARRSSAAGGLDETIPDTGAAAEEQAAVWERRQQVRQALRQLGGRCEQLLSALFLASGPPSYDAIAEQLGMKVGSIGPTRARCFKKLELILVEMGLESEVSGSSSGPSSG
jgi:RNA polymerase sigma factor (sigma-70 family)